MALIVRLQPACRLSSNQFSGGFPTDPKLSWPQLPLLPAPLACRLSSNQFNGGFPTGLATYPNLTFLLLDNNDFRQAQLGLLEMRSTEQLGCMEGWRAWSEPPGWLGGS